MENGGIRSEPRLPFPHDIRYTPDASRVLTGYKVWRLSAGQENNEPAWTLLTPQTITDLSFADTGWQTLPNGDYRWAVKAIYTAEVASAPALSNVLHQAGRFRYDRRCGSSPKSTPISGATVTAGGSLPLRTPPEPTRWLCRWELTALLLMQQDSYPKPWKTCSVNQNLTTTVNFVLTTGSPNEDPIVPVAETVLKGNYPNPFNPSTTIAYSVKETGAVWIGIYNVKGQLIRTLVNDTRATGHYTMDFDGRDDNGRSISSGIYFLKMRSGAYQSTRKMIMMQ
jgi:hypothetical protein